MVEAGQTFTRIQNGYRNGVHTPVQITVMVLEVFEGYQSLWSRETYQYGVRFRMEDDVDGRASFHALDLHTFEHVWVH